MVLENDSLTWGIVAAFFIVLCLMGFVLRRRIRRAYQIQLFLIVVAGMWIFPIWHTATKLAIAALGVNGWIMIGAALLSSLLGFISYYQDSRRRLRLARKSHKASGRLDHVRGLWNRRVPLQLDSPEEEAQWRSIARWALAFAPAIGQFLARPETRGQVFSALLLFVSIYGLMLGIARGLAIVVEIKLLENELGKKLLVPIEDDSSGSLKP